MDLKTRARLWWKKWRNERLYRRIPISSPIKITIRSTGAVLDETIGDWSPGGVFIRTSKPLPLEEMVDLEFSLGNQSSLLRLRGQVVRLQSEDGAEQVSGMGIMFTDFTQAGMTILREILATSASDVNLTPA